MSFFGPIKRLEFRKLEERVAKLEEKVNKTARKDQTTLRQQLLLLHHTGMLDTLNDLKMSREKKAKLLSVLLNGSFDNIRDYLTEVNKRDSQLKTVTNYNVIVKTFKESGLKALEEKTDIILDQLKKQDSENL
jgi:hypothetical protein